MRVVGLAAGALVLQVACGPSLAATKDEVCATPYVVGSEMPGPRLGALYSALRRQDPTTPRCGPRSKLESCTVLDRSGYLETFTEWTEQRPGGGADRDLVTREARREHRARLPYGVVWSDDQAEVMRKLKALKTDPSVSQEPSGPRINVPACFRNKHADGFWTDFRFDKAGHLVSVTQAVDWT
jgi:hypothetical protein